MEKVKWSEKVTNEEVLGRMGEERTLLNNIVRRKANWIGHILRRNCLLHDSIGQMTEVKGVGRRTQLLDVLRDRRRYWDTAVYQTNIRKKYKLSSKSMDLLIRSTLNYI